MEYIPIGSAQINKVFYGISSRFAVLNKTASRDCHNPEGLFTRLLKADPKIR